MPEVNGRVKAISIKDRNTRNGVAKVYSLCVDDVWYNNGFTALNEIEKGSEVRIEFHADSYGNKIDSIVRTGGATSAPGTAAPAKGGRGTDVQQAIIRQNALAHATQVVLATLPVKPKREDVIKDVIKTARCFEQFSDGTIDAIEDKETADSILSQE